MIKKWIAACAAVGAGLWGIAGCGDGASSSAADAGQAGRPVIGISLLTSANPFFVDMSDAMAQAAEEAGYDVVVVSGDLDPAKQQNQVDDFLTQGVDAIVLCPVDSKAIGTAVQRANEAGVPVFTADIAVLAEGAEVVSHVATDNYEGGRLAAEAIAEALGGSGQVAIIDHPEVESVILRTRGFEDRLAELRSEEGVQIEIVAKLPGRGAKEQSFKAAEDILTAHPQLDGIFAINDPSAMGAVAALEKAGRLDDIAVIGFDGAPEAMAALAGGKIYADIVQHPRQIGTRVIQAVSDYGRGLEVPPEQLISPSVVKQEEAKALQQQG